MVFFFFFFFFVIWMNKPLEKLLHFRHIKKPQRDNLFSEYPWFVQYMLSAPWPYDGPDANYNYYNIASRLVPFPFGKLKDQVIQAEFFDFIYYFTKSNFFSLQRYLEYYFTPSLYFFYFLLISNFLIFILINSYRTYISRGYYNQKFYNNYRPYLDNYCYSLFRLFLKFPRTKKTFLIQNAFKSQYLDYLIFFEPLNYWKSSILSENAFFNSLFPEFIKYFINNPKHYMDIEKIVDIDYTDSELQEDQIETYDPQPSSATLPLLLLVLFCILTIIKQDFFFFVAFFF